MKTMLSGSLNITDAAIGSYMVFGQVFSNHEHVSEHSARLSH